MTSKSFKGTSYFCMTLIVSKLGLETEVKDVPVRCLKKVVSSVPRCKKTENMALLEHRWQFQWHFPLAASNDQVLASPAYIYA